MALRDTTSLPSPAQPARHRRADLLRAAALVACLVILGWGGEAVAPALGAVRGAAEQDGAAWEGRRLAAQFLWLKVHAVLHAGVEEREARAGERESRQGEFHAHAENTEGGDRHSHEEHAEEEAGHVFVIPPAREDFRGVLGDLERATKPYLGPDGTAYAKDADQTIPFYRLVTRVDPHFIQGYTVGAQSIARAGKHADAGIAYLEEGARHNPASFEIQTELGHFWLVYKRRYDLAERHLLRALELVPTGRELTELEQEARLDAYRWLALNYREWGRAADAVRIAREGLQVVGEDAALLHVAQSRGRK
ncbi:MAG: hypothetical protein ACK47B_21060 [Armatimonadota bacterium]